jgi:hypothetical protein
VTIEIISSQIDKSDFDADARFESAGVDSTPRKKSKADAQNRLTRSGGAVLADFVVMLAWNGVHTLARKSRNQTQSRRLQLIKILF